MFNKDAEVAATGNNKTDTVSQGATEAAKKICSQNKIGESDSKLVDRLHNISKLAIKCKSDAEKRKDKELSNLYKQISIKSDDLIKKLDFLEIQHAKNIVVDDDSTKKIMNDLNIIRGLIESLSKKASEALESDKNFSEQNLNKLAEELVKLQEDTRVFQDTILAECTIKK
jgi:hypothetical protein